MAQYINKDTLVAEIKRRKDESWLGNYTKEKGIVFDITDDILSWINTLEVKEVDINKEISQFIDANFEKAKIGHKLSLRHTAKYFFELGMAASNKAQKGE